MMLTYILFLAAALIWPLRRICRAGGALLPFFSVLLTSADVLLGLLNRAEQTEMALCVMTVLLMALLIPEGGGEA